MDLALVSSADVRPAVPEVIEVSENQYGLLRELWVTPRHLRHKIDELHFGHRLVSSPRPDLTEAVVTGRRETALEKVLFDQGGGFGKAF
jgi:hypothetical protein